jgi:dolichol-phosphate mannosyltransferase
MKFAAWKLKFKIAEVPITFVDRKFGVSKMNKGIVKEGILGVLKLRWQSLFKDYHARMKSKGENVANFTSEKVMAESNS